MQKKLEHISNKPYSHFGAFSNKCTKGKKWPLKSDTITYLFAFNGKENDNEVKGDGNQQDYGMRIYDNRLGKFLSVDPLADEYPMLTPYQFAGNMPVRYIDLDGLEPGDPMYYVVEGFRQYFDVGVNLFNFNFDLSFNKTSGTSTGSGTTSATTSTSTVNTTSASYTGWDFFKPGAWPTGGARIGNAPVPKVTLKNTTTVQKATTVVVVTAPGTKVQTKTVTSEGGTTTTQKVSGTVVSNSGVPVTASASTSTTKSTTGTSTTNTGQIAVGTDQANVYMQTSKTTTSGGQTTTSTGVGVEVNLQTPPVGGNSVGVNATIQVGVNRPK